MPAFSTLSTLAVLALSAVSEARPIPHTVSLFRRAILNASDGVLVIQNKDAPKGYSDNLEPYDHYHFRYMAIGCGDVDKKAEFFDTCCKPRPSDKQSDDQYPAACQLASYLVFNPEYKGNKVVAQLGSVRDYQKKIGYEEKDVKTESTSSSEKKEPASSSQASSSTWTPESSKKSSSSSSQWVPSSSSSSWTPEATPSSSQWVPPPSSSSQWVPEPAPSSSYEEVWTEPSKQEEAAWTPSPSSSEQAPAPSPPSNNNNNNDNNGGGSSGDFSGQASWFTQNGNPGACGIYHSDSDHIVALQVDMYGNTGQQSQYCGRSLTITNTATGATAQAVVADACPGCATYHSLDLSTGLFQALGSLDQGILPISWHFN